MASDIKKGFYQYDDFIGLPRVEDPWLIKPLIPVGGWVNLYGQPKKGRKSYWALGAGHAVCNANVKDFLGFEVHNHGPVLYLQADTPHATWCTRMEDLASGGMDFTNMWIASLDTLPHPLSLEVFADELRGYVERGPKEAAMIVYDTGRAMHRMNENESHSMQTVLDTLTEIAGKGRAKLLITHEKKNGGDIFSPNQNEHERESDDLMKGNRGSSAVSGAMDTIIKTTAKNMMYYQGRSVADKYKRLTFDHLHDKNALPCPHPTSEDCGGWMWHEDLPPIEIEARKLLVQYPSPKQASTWSLGRQLQKKMETLGETVTVDQARKLIKKLRGES